MKYIKNIAMLLIAALVAVSVASCTDDTTESGVADRLFRPVNIILSASGTTVSATWAGIEGAAGYTAELYKRNVVEVEEEGETVEYEDMQLVALDENIPTNEWIVRGLEYDTQYYFRVKANASNMAENSYFSEFENIKTPMETQVLKVTVDDPIEGNVTFTWMTGYDLTYIKVTAADGTETEHAINDAEGSLSLRKLDAGVYTAVAGNGEKEYNVVEFLIPVMYEVSSSEITFDEVTLRWAADGNITTVQLVNVVTGEEKTYPAPASGVLVIPAAELGFYQTYDVTLIYADGATSNTVRFTTLSQKPEGVIVVSTADELTNAISTCANGAVIALNPGEYHVQKLNDSGVLEYQAININKSLTLMAATGEMPLVMVKQFNLVAAATIDLVRIEGIEFAGYDEDDKNSSDTYLFNLDAGSTACVTRLEIENNKIHGISNSLIRADRNKAYTVLNIYINNNFMWNMNGKQSYISTYNANDGVPAETITFTNNTITRLSWKNATQRPFAWLASEQLVVNISNNTFYDCQNGKTPFAEARGTFDGSYGTVIMKNNIFYSQPADPAKAPNNQPSLGDGVKFTNEGNVLGFVWGSYNSTSGVLTTYDWSEYGALVADPEFADAANLDFTVTNEQVANLRAGDPRWLK